MKNIFYILIAAFSLILHAKCVGQNNIVYGAGISYTNGVPTFVPPSKSARVAIDTATSKWYEYATPGGWRWSGDRVQDISGCAAPAYTPGKAQSRLVLNNCTEVQNGHGPELYKYTGSAWLCLNCGGNYTAGDGIDITGAEITNTAPDQVVSITGAGINAVTGTYPNFTVTGTEVDGSTTNELQTLSVAGSNLSISGGNTVTLPTPSSTLDALTDVTITAPTNAQILQYNTATTQWVNATLSAITGTGVVNYIPKWATSATQDASAIYQASSKIIGVNTSSPVNMPGWTGGATINIHDAAGLPNLHLSNPSNWGGFGLDNTRCYFPTKTSLQFIYNGVTGQGGNLSFINSTSGSSVFVLIADNQNRVCVGAAPSSAAAKFEVTSTTQGVLFPRMTATQRDAIASPPDGLVVYNTTAAKLQVRAASAWVDLH